MSKLWVDYTNHAGKRAWREIERSWRTHIATYPPEEVKYIGERKRERCTCISVFMVDRNAMRTLALKSIHGFHEGDAPPSVENVPTATAMHYIERELAALSEYATDDLIPITLARRALRRKPILQTTTEAIDALLGLRGLADSVSEIVKINTAISTLADERGEAKLSPEFEASVVEERLTQLEEYGIKQLEELRAMISCQERQIDEAKDTITTLLATNVSQEERLRILEAALGLRDAAPKHVFDRIETARDEIKSIAKGALTGMQIEVTHYDGNRKSADAVVSDGKGVVGTTTFHGTGGKAMDHSVGGAVRQMPDGTIVTGPAAGPDMPQSWLTFERLRISNINRQVEWDVNNQLKGAVGVLYRANELAGEVGELCNKVKKLVRADLGIAGSRTTIDEITTEIGDAVICLDLLATAISDQYAPVTLGNAACTAFNDKSAELKLKTRI